MARNFGPGSFSDNYDNDRSRSVDRDQHPGGVTGLPFHDNVDLLKDDFSPQHDEAKRSRPRNIENRQTDLGRGPAGTEWNRDISENDMDNFARSELRPDLSDPHSDVAQKYYGRAPKGWKRSDERILEEVCLALQRSSVVDPSDVEVKVEEGCVYMRGTMPSRGMRRVAEDLVSTVPGVVDVFSQVKTPKRS